MKRNGEGNWFRRHSWTLAISGLTLVILLWAGAGWWLTHDGFAHAVRSIGGRYRAEMVDTRLSAFFSYLNGRQPTVFHWVELEGSDADDAWLEAHHSDISQLTHLSLFLRNMHVSGEGLATLRKLSNVHCLDLTGTPLTDGDVEHLVTLPNAVQLWIGRTGISDTALAGLASSPNLVSICIDRTQATPQGISGLSKFPRLRDLILVDADDESLGSITGLKGLTSISVMAEDLTPACLPGLKQMQGLQALTLYDSEFSDAEIGELKQALPRCNVSQFNFVPPSFPSGSPTAAR